MEKKAKEDLVEAIFQQHAVEFSSSPKNGIRERVKLSRKDMMGILETVIAQLTK